MKIQNHVMTSSMLIIIKLIYSTLKKFLRKLYKFRARFFSCRRRYYENSKSYDDVILADC